ncbi:hypothetical protein GYMLUDRAFT_260042 [Collybiopsis luxurians FD-317 M1]|uniref:Cyclin N-terminal domain-containing protein n=1 Tax=Collybiopsis luxurians FD-317 M1 TaxID=944289 RepID=A0A0D0BFV1_9AGAR|nr:hypothetical protein GYMLUDRAFT_260042 [Collybiopsis luxurians FD-317 M1]
MLPSDSSMSLYNQMKLLHHSMDSPNLQLVELRPSKYIIDYIVACVADTVDFALRRPLYTERGHVERGKFTEFVATILERAQVKTPVILASLVYIDRVRPFLKISLDEWALERVFLGAVIVASKYLNDIALKNVCWASCTGILGSHDIGVIEREFLWALDWGLRISEDDLLPLYTGIFAAINPQAWSFQSHFYDETASLDGVFDPLCAEFKRQRSITPDDTSSFSLPSSFNKNISLSKSPGRPAYSGSYLRELIQDFPLPPHCMRNNFTTTQI